MSLRALMGGGPAGVKLWIDDGWGCGGRGLGVSSGARFHALQTLADAPDCTTTHALKWIAKADLMMRQAQSAMRSLLRLQAARRKIEADPKAYDRGERIEHTMTALMTQALEPNVSPDDPESQNHVIRFCRDTPKPALITTTEPQPPPIHQPVSPDDPKSQNHVIEIPPRQPETAPTQRWAAPATISPLGPRQRKRIRRRPLTPGRPTAAAPEGPPPYPGTRKPPPRSRTGWTSPPRSRRSEAPRPPPPAPAHSRSRGTSRH